MTAGELEAADDTDDNDIIKEAVIEMFNENKHVPIDISFSIIDSHTEPRRQLTLAQRTAQWTN